MQVIAGLLKPFLDRKIVGSRQESREKHMDWTRTCWTSALCHDSGVWI